MRALLIVISLLFVTSVGCTSTTVKKDPGTDDSGLRYYRPKPYLLLSPAVVETKAVPNMVKIELRWLPDFNEEYSIHVHAGFGTNTTDITLEDGWNLTGFDVDVDSKTSENLKAIAGVVGKFAPTGAPRSQVIAKQIPAAHNVPLGFYEAVISESCGVKRMHGWRYIGFSPFTPCPVIPTGGTQVDDCRCGKVYGLISEGGTMMFKLLQDVSTTQVEAKDGVLWNRQP